ncbi:PAP2 superfamily [Carpediemonas membranifera]|uniref:PAP2 superfamily n=1 Tax=Carpediemonas membranifera TaxID=201153 RepID=A0A8J6B863_9EUKA|nr:PAP2 superfamily [Carpediemonas membranifera]|eukprot:KAG9392022.1 PAP2 superfamily [Carpediemonas membranifera]
MAVSEPGKGLVGEALEAKYCLVDTSYEGVSIKFKRKKPTSFVFDFPRSVEDKWRRFDDALLRYAQSADNKFFHVFDYVMTFLTCVEIGCIIPTILFALALDDLGLYSLILSTFTAIVSQIPKRFVWRDRPYMQGRAFRRRKDETSSIPSRAVTCAVVYSIGGVCAYLHTNLNIFGLVVSLPLFVASVPFIILTAIARIQLGVHFPTDCILGVFQGLFIVGISIFTYAAIDLACAAGFVAAPLTLATIPWIWILLGHFAGILVAFVGLAPPARLWSKSPVILALLAPPLLFAAILECPSKGRVLFGDTDASLLTVLTAVAWVGMLAVVVVVGVRLIQTKATGGGIMIAIGYFAVMSVLQLLGLVMWRIYIGQPEFFEG